MQKGFASILIIIILAAALLGGYFIYRQITQPLHTPDETATWKTYENNKKGYTFKYPPTWKIVKDEYHAEGCSTFIIQSPDFQLEEGLVFNEVIGGVEIKVGCGKYAKQFVTIKDLFTDDPLSQQGVYKNKSSLLIATVPAIQYDYFYESMNATVTIFLHNDLLYSVQIRYPNSAESRSIGWDIYKRILATFKFLP